MFLELEGYAVVSAEDGEKGLAALRRLKRPGMVLLDLMMPVMDGWQFLEEVSKVDSLAAIPIVVVTAYVEKSRGLRVRAIIKKPIDIEQLLQSVRRLCGEPEVQYRS
jgi:CheY-like chemotaxis protein